MSPGKILGIGGIFFKSDHQNDLNQWYERHLGLRHNETGAVACDWRLPGDPDGKHRTVWSIFPGSSKYFDPSPARFMIN